MSRATTTVTRHGDIVAVTLAAADQTLLRNLAGQVGALLGGGAPEGSTDPLEQLVGMTDEDVTAPDDPALQRLLPDAYADDEAAQEFRRLTDTELRRTKVDALERFAADLGEPRVELADADAEQWLQALNDIRLVLGVRLDVREDMDDLVRSLSADDPRLPLLYAYDRVTRLQDALLDALDG